jgi:hypothetical protein
MARATASDRGRLVPHPLGVLNFAAAGSLETRRERPGQLRGLTDYLLAETQVGVGEALKAGGLCNLGISPCESSGTSTLSGFLEGLRLSARPIVAARHCEDVAGTLRRLRRPPTV